jgi:hypothetical protein
MLDRKIVAACCEIHTKQINALWRKNVEFLKDKFSGTFIDHSALLVLWVYKPPVRMKLKQTSRNLSFLCAVTPMSAVCGDMTPSDLVKI